MDHFDFHHDNAHRDGWAPAHFLTPGQRFALACGCGEHVTDSLVRTGGSVGIDTAAGDRIPLDSLDEPIWFVGGPGTSVDDC